MIFEIIPFVAAILANVLIVAEPFAKATAIWATGWIVIGFPIIGPSVL